MSWEWQKNSKDVVLRVNALWPKTTIATSAVRNLMGGEEICKQSRKPDIMADAAHHMLTQTAKALTGNFFVDEDVLTRSRRYGLRDYSVVPGATSYRTSFSKEKALGTQRIPKAFTALSS